MRHQPRPQDQQTAADNSGSPAQQARPRVDGASGCAAALAADLEGSIDWEWLYGLQCSQRWGPALRVDLEAGTVGGLLPAAYELTDRLLAQVAGRRRVLLLSPEQAFSGLYPYATHHPYDRHSMVDLEAPDAGLWPKASGLRGVAAILQPGDVLHVPAYWSVCAGCCGWLVGAASAGACCYSLS